MSNSPLNPIKFESRLWKYVSADLHPPIPKPLLHAHVPTHDSVSGSRPKLFPKILSWLLGGLNPVAMLACSVVSVGAIR